MSFGLANASTHFMFLMNSVFMLELDKSIMVFIDNILVYSKSMEEHEEHLLSCFNDYESTSGMPSLVSVNSGWVKCYSWAT
jgi:hypothetical protein